MQLQELTLQQFRSYSKRTFIFPKNTTIFLGPNAIGKTNILESIFFLSTGKSFRAEYDREVVKWGSEVGRIQGKFFSKPLNSPETLRSELQIRSGTEDFSFSADKPLLTSPLVKGRENWSIANEGEEVVGDETMLEIVLTTGMVMGQKAQIKKFLVNGVARRLVDFAAQLKTVLFEPEDLDLVRGTPSLRRKYLDNVLIQVDREYRRSLFSYEKGVRQRNKLLERIRDEGIPRTQLLFWDQLLIKSGQYITQKREELIAALNDSQKPFGNFTVVYDASLISEARLKQYEVEEVAAATTLVGPHRDDLEFFEHDRDMSKFGSRGEQRLVVLWLKLAELDFIKAKTGERPLLLLDDIFSELDYTHREEVLKVIDLQQTIITTADRHFLPADMVKSGDVVELGGDK